MYTYYIWLLNKQIFSCIIGEWERERERQRDEWKKRKESAFLFGSFIIVSKYKDVARIAHAGSYGS